MPDLPSRLRDVERVPPPDLWNEIVSREPRPQRDGGTGRRWALAAAAVVVAISVALPLAWLIGGRDTAPVDEPSEEPTGSREPRHRPFVPQTRREGDLVVMPVTFPDGTSAELTYPVTLDLASMGVQPDVSLISDAAPGRLPFTFFHGEVDPAWLAEEEPRGTFRTRSGVRAEIWAGTDDQPENPNLVHRADPMLIFRLPSWSVVLAVPDGLSPHDVVRDVDLTETPDGWPVASAIGAFELAEGYGEARGPQLTLGDRAPSEHAVIPTADRWIDIAPATTCPKSFGEPADDGAAFCLGSGSVRLYVGITAVSRDPDFVRAVYDGLRARAIRPG